MPHNIFDIPLQREKRKTLFKFCLSDINNKIKQRQFEQPERDDCP